MTNTPAPLHHDVLTCLLPACLSSSLGSARWFSKSAGGCSFLCLGPIGQPRVLPPCLPTSTHPVPPSKQLPDWMLPPLPLSPSGWELLEVGGLWWSLSALQAEHSPSIHISKQRRIFWRWLTKVLWLNEFGQPWIKSA